MKIGLWRIAALLVLAQMAYPNLSVAQEDIVIIVNENVPVASLSQNDLERIYLGKMQKWSNQQSILAHYMVGDAYKLSFFDNKIGVDYTRFNKYWMKKTFAGDGASPDNVRNVEDMIAKVERHSGAIGFIPRSSVAKLNTAKVLQ